MIEWPSLYQIFDFVGTMAFAISGTRLASAKRFDWFGAYVVGVTTAIGGGTLRDVLLGVTPFWMTTPTYFICSAFALFWVVLFRKRLVRQNNTWFLFDAIGLALFTVTGMEKTLSLGFSYWVAIIMGTMTGAAGGVLRDVLINEVPLIFRKEIYAIACVIGGLVFCGCDLLNFSTEVSAIVGGITVFVIRILAVKYGISLPILKGEQISPEDGQKNKP
jgi:uncharacterized membrane protein YeiH